MNTETKTNIDLRDLTREIKGYCPSRADSLVDGNYDLTSLDQSFEEACQKLAAFRKGLESSSEEDKLSEKPRKNNKKNQ